MIPTQRSRSHFFPVPLFLLCVWSILVRGRPDPRVDARRRRTFESQRLRNDSQDVSVPLHATTLLFFSSPCPLWVTRLWTTFSPAPAAPSPTGTGDESMCAPKGDGFVIVTGKIPGGKFLTCLCSGISNQRPMAEPTHTPHPPHPPSGPAWATPLIVSDRGNWFQLTSIQRLFDWQTKDTATWRRSRPEVVRWSGPLRPAGLIPLCFGADETGSSCSGGESDTFDVKL